MLRADQANATYWLWMSAVVESARERTYCLQNAQRLDPQNRPARLGLVISGHLAPEDSLRPDPILPRAWTLPDETRFLLPSFDRGQRRRLIVFGVMGLLLLLAIVGGLGLRNSFPGKAALLTVTPIYRTSTIAPSPLPSLIPRPHKTSIVRTSPTPLWMLLDATYTPTPLYVDTPHPISETYRASICAFQSGDFASMLNYIKQAAREEPNSADLQYYLAEAYRLSDDPQLALSAYQKSIKIDSEFAPAWLGMARVAMAIDPRQDILPDLQTALEIDPDLVEAYLLRAEIRIRLGDHEAALEDLAEVEYLAPQSPALYLYRAQAYLGLGAAQQALENARLARQLDQASLPAYLALGIASLSSDQPAHAADALKTYLVYQPEYASAWSALGQALYRLGRDFPAALEALNCALAIEPEDLPALLHRGLVFLELDEGQLAVNDLFNARKLDPQSFQATLGLGRGFYLTGRLAEATSVMTASQALAETDQELAQAHYWRALARRAEGETLLAAADWRALLDLPAAAVPADWLAQAEQALLLLTPTASPTLTYTLRTPTAEKTDSGPARPPQRLLCQPPGRLPERQHRPKLARQKRPPLDIVKA